ncbi:MAG: tRNA pseudouridine(55) synthase TruB [Proteobacteria bacterium]|nr:tRNA pseudouridine(55) synthase TruB [Pseudomonadota bacterium]
MIPKVTFPLDGILLLNKPYGISSNLALQKAKHLLKAQKAGHTGSLDPLATGMLPLCFGQATKFSRFLLEEKKCYQAKLKLGITTTTGDSEGEILRIQNVPILTSELTAKVLSHFQGTQQQIPPMYSAIKHQGQPLYKLARQGKEINRSPRTITIHRLDLDGVDQHDGDFMTMTIVCSKGTYIRTLVEDIGNYLGCGAHLSELHRLWVWPFEQQEMVSMPQLVEYGIEARSFVLPIEATLARLLPVIKLCKDKALYLSQGQQIEVATSHSGWVALMSSHGNFLGVGELLEHGRLAPRRLLNQNEPIWGEL